MLYRFGQHELDTSRFEITRDGRPIDVEPKVLKLLTLLIENRDRVVSRAELHRELWGRRIVTDNTLNVCLRSARHAVADSGREQGVIRTVHGAGYQFVADVSVRAHRGSELRATSPDGPGTYSDHPETFPDRALAGQPTIAIMPFETIGQSDTEVIVARGLVHDIITRIARSRLMFVIARGTAFNFNTEGKDVAEIGRALGVRYVVQGAVQASSGRLRVSAALASALTRQELWSEQYRRKLDDVLELQEEIADSVVTSLESEVEREEVQRSLLMPSTNLDAWSAYHRGLHHMYRFRFEECDKAERLFRRSIDLEPNLPRPYAGLSFINFERVFLGFDEKPQEGIRKAIDYAEQGLAIDALDPMAHWALARALYLTGDLESSKDALQTALDLNPSYAIAQYSLGWVAMQIGDHELSRERIAWARRLSPFDPLKFGMLGVLALNLVLMGETEEALALSAQAVSQPNAHYMVPVFAAVTHALAGRFETARGYIRPVRAVWPEYGWKEFAAMFPFRREADMSRIRRAFEHLQTGKSS